MSTGYQSLTEKEKQTLRLMLRGHDAKSLARHLDLSVHTINERLRNARQKLSVSSSREAARLLLESEAPEKSADKQIGEAGAAAIVADPGASNDGSKARTRFAWPIAGVVIMSPILVALALASSPQDTASTSAASTEAPAAAATETEAVAAARAWLVLSDEGRWAEGWSATGSSFRELNTVERWTEAALQARAPLGALVSRTLLSQEAVPAPPAGVDMIRFRSSFANRAEAIETVTLVREDGVLKVVGVMID